MDSLVFDRLQKKIRPTEGGKYAENTHTYIESYIQWKCRLDWKSARDVVVEPGQKNSTKREHRGKKKCVRRNCPASGVHSLMGLCVQKQKNSTLNSRKRMLIVLRIGSGQKSPKQQQQFCPTDEDIFHLQFTWPDKEWSVQHHYYITADVTTSSEYTFMQSTIKLAAKNFEQDEVAGRAADRLGCFISALGPSWIGSFFTNGSRTTSCQKGSSSVRWGEENHFTYYVQGRPSRIKSD